MPQHTIDERMKEKEQREDKAGKLLKEKGGSMNKAEKAFVGHFKKKDSTVPVGFVPSEKES